MTPPLPLGTDRDPEQGGDKDTEAGLGNGGKMHGHCAYGALHACVNTAATEDFELKSKSGHQGNKGLEGANKTMIARIEGARNPNFFFLAYDRKRLFVTDLEIVPKHVFSRGMIAPKKPLAPTARHAGWQGRFILRDEIPQTGRIALVRDGRIVPRAQVLDVWTKMLFLRKGDTTARGWLLEVIHCIEGLHSRQFGLTDLYACEAALRAKFPGNANIQAKLRQQLQKLRDQGYLAFAGNGEYRLVGTRPGAG
jgi:type II restriction enzyme